MQEAGKIIMISERDMDQLLVRTYVKGLGMGFVLGGIACFIGFVLFGGSAASNTSKSATTILVDEAVADINS